MAPFCSFQPVFAPRTINIANTRVLKDILSELAYNLKVDVMGIEEAGIALNG